MDSELTRLEAQRAQLVDRVQSREHQTSFMMYFSLLVVGVVFILLASAVFAGQLSLTGLFWSTLLAGLLFFILSRRMRSGPRVAMVADLVFGGVAETDPEYFRAQIAECDRRIASLKSAEKL